MKKREKQAALLLALASGAAMAAALPLAALPAFGRWLRALSLSGGTGNLAWVCCGGAGAGGTGCWSWRRGRSSRGYSSW